MAPRSTLRHRAVPYLCPEWQTPLSRKLRGAPIERAQTFLTAKYRPLSYLIVSSSVVCKRGLAFDRLSAKLALAPCVLYRCACLPSLRVHALVRPGIHSALQSSFRCGSAAFEATCLSLAEAYVTRVHSVTGACVLLASVFDRTAHARARDCDADRSCAARFSLRAQHIAAASLSVPSSLKARESRLPTPRFLPVWALNVRHK